MTKQEAETQAIRIDEYNKLNARRNKYYATLNAITKKDPNGPCQQGPFTGNTRESRRIQALDIKFTQTRGGAPAVDMHLFDLELEAYEFASYLQEHLAKKIKELTDAIEAI